jgi:hypothetical protein
MGLRFRVYGLGTSSSKQSFFFYFASQSLHNRKKFKKKCGDVNYEANFLFIFWLHKRAKPIHPPYIHPSDHLSTHPSAHPSGSDCEAK